MVKLITQNMVLAEILGKKKGKAAKGSARICEIRILWEYVG